MAQSGDRVTVHGLVDAASRRVVLTLLGLHVGKSGETPLLRSPSRERLRRPAITAGSMARSETGQNKSRNVDADSIDATKPGCAETRTETTRRPLAKISGD